jgi:hypothetical protein
MFNLMPHKTLKREVALVLMGWLLAISTWVAITGGTPQALQVIDMFMLPIGLIFAGAFGLDWVTKQTTIAGPPAPPPD